MLLTVEFKKQIIAELLKARENYTGNDAQFAHIYDLNKSVFSRVKSGETERIIDDTKWITIAAKLNMTFDDTEWKLARTEVFERIEEAVMICKEDSVMMFFVDASEIGKTAAARYKAKELKNCFYVDCSQCKTKQLFIRTIARTVGLDNTGKYNDVKAALKLTLNIMAGQDRPAIILDEAGDLDYPAFLEIKELYNATEGRVGWLLIGADGLKAKIESGKRHKKVGFVEIYSRGGAKYRSVVSDKIGKERIAFYKQLVSEALIANGCPKNRLNEIVNQCIVQDDNGEIYAMRRAKVILKDVLRGGAR